MLSTTDAIPAQAARPRRAATPEDTDAAVLLLLSRDIGLVRVLLEGTAPTGVRLRLVRTPAKALAYLTRHSPDAFVVDAITGLPDEARTMSELSLVLRRRSIPLVVVSPAGRAARIFLQVCASRAVDIHWSRDRAGRRLGSLVRAAIERRHRQLRVASVLTPLARSLPR